MKPEHIALVLQNALRDFPGLVARHEPAEDETVDDAIAVYDGDKDTGWHIQIGQDRTYMVGHFDNERGILREFGIHTKAVAACFYLIKAMASDARAKHTPVKARRA